MTRRGRHARTTIAFLLAIVWMARTAGAQDYPHYPAAGSTFVPLDSWVYPAFERLGAMGYVTTSLEGMKPWTRTECARLTEDAGDAIRQAVQEDKNPLEESVKLHQALAREFAAEIEVMGGGRNLSLRLESVYARALSISGPALTDGFHFGQTVAYDFGRPFRRGFNSFAGGAVRATAGPFAFYVRAEFQHSPSAPALSTSTLNLISTLDQKPVQAAQPFARVSRVRLLDAYVSVNLQNWQLSFGKQSLSWGPGEGGSMLLSDNAEPLVMGRITRVVPARLPGFMSKAGPYRVEFFVGRQEGGSFIPHPLIYGHKFSFRVSPHVEIGYGRTVILGAGDTHLGSAFTFGNLIHNFFGIRVNNQAPGIPGDTRDSFDFVVRVPRLRNGALLYGDLYADDKPVYFVQPGRGAYRFGVFIARAPGIPKLDLRFEVTSTESPSDPIRTGTLNYWNFIYHDGYTNFGVPMGNAVGREGKTYQFWSTYHWGPQNNLQFAYKHSSLDAGFIPQGGGHWEDYAVRHEIHLPSGLYVRSGVQYEHIGSYRALFGGPKNNVTASIELGFAPQHENP